MKKFAIMNENVSYGEFAAENPEQALEHALLSADWSVPIEDYTISVVNRARGGSAAINGNGAPSTDNWFTVDNIDTGDQIIFDVSRR